MPAPLTPTSAVERPALELEIETVDDGASAPRIAERHVLEPDGERLAERQAGIRGAFDDGLARHQFIAPTLESLDRSEDLRAELREHVGLRVVLTQQHGECDRLGAERELPDADAPLAREDGGGHEHPQHEQQAEGRVDEVGLEEDAPAFTGDLAEHREIGRARAIGDPSRQVEHPQFLRGRGARSEAEEVLVFAAVPRHVIPHTRVFAHAAPLAVAEHHRDGEDADARPPSDHQPDDRHESGELGVPRDECEHAARAGPGSRPVAVEEAGGRVEMIEDVLVLQKTDPRGGGDDPRDVVTDEPVEVAFERL